MSSVRCLMFLLSLGAILNCWQSSAAAAVVTKSAGTKTQQRTGALPLLYLLAYPGALQQLAAPIRQPMRDSVPTRRPMRDSVPSRRPMRDSVPSRRPMRDSVPTRQPSQTAVLTNRVQADAPAASLNNADMAMIREQFIQGLLQGLQTGAQQTNPTIQPSVLADLLAQVASATTTTTEAPSITPPSLEKDFNTNDDGEYDYIDFKNGSRIKYELDERLTSNSSDHYPTKILQKAPEDDAPNSPAAASQPTHTRPLTNYVVYRPRPQLYLYHVG